MPTVTILAGSVYGAALMTAQSLASLLRAQGFAVQLHDNPTLADFTADDGLLLICTSTTGQGELPANLVPLYLDLRERMPLQPGRPFALVVLGDSSYGDTFCGAGELMMEALLELGCQPLTDPLRLDALEDDQPEQVAWQWCRQWLSRLDWPA